jgi:hypothetical protein
MIFLFSDRINQTSLKSFASAGRMDRMLRYQRKIIWYRVTAFFTVDVDLAIGVLQLQLAAENPVPGQPPLDLRLVSSIVRKFVFFLCFPPP